MTRSVPSALIAALAVLTAALPLRHLFAGTTFMRPALLTVVAIVLAGIAVRALTRSVTAVFAVQVVVLVECLSVYFARDTLWYLLPTPATAERVADLLLQSRETILAHAAPAPVNPGIDFSLAAIIALLALTADLAAATAELPTLAGLPVVALYGISAANAPAGLPWLDFVVPAALWLLLLARQTRDQQRRWVNHVVGGGEDAEESAHRDFVRQGAGLAAAGLALAIVVPTVVPHLPPTVIGTGLQPGDDGAGPGGRGRVSISSEIDLRRSMEDQDPSPVLRYRTDDPNPPPLRVGVARDFTAGRARIESTERLVPLGDLTELALPTAQEETRTTVVEESRIRAPQLPAPYAAEAVDGLGRWSVDDEGVIRVGRAPDAYTIAYRPPLSDTEAVTERATPGGVDLLADRQQYLGVDEEIRAELEAIDDEIVDPGSSPLETAQAIQSYLRGSDFTYDLELAPRGAGEHPVTHFLRTKQGYCQQFAAAMVHLARARGIPARFVVGFLPGAIAEGSGADAERVVRAADAHAWPELYIDGVGWLRFEPTPGARAAAVPGYSIQRQEVTETTTTTTTSTTSSTTSETSQAAPEDTAAGATTDLSWLRPLLWLLAAAALLAVLPLTALVLRERARRSARTPTEQIEADWLRLVTDLEDLGVEAPSGATPRATVGHLARRTGSRGQAQLHRVVATLERARYAPPAGAPGPEDAAQVHADVDDLVTRVSRSRAGGQRVRSALAPGSAVRWWTGLPGRLTGALRMLLRR